MQSALLSMSLKQPDTFGADRQLMLLVNSQPMSMENHTDKEKVRFLKDEYGIGGRSHALSGATHSGEDHDGKGLHYKKQGCPDVHLNWEKVAKRITSLVPKGRYLTEQEQAQYNNCLLYTSVHLVAGKFHKEIRETEQDKVGVESAHKSEEAVETSAYLVREGYRSHKLKPYRKAAQAERQLEKANVNALYQKSLRENPHHPGEGFHFLLVEGTDHDPVQIPGQHPGGVLHRFPPPDL